jgi:hypothetical protein
MESTSLIPEINPQDLWLASSFLQPTLNLIPIDKGQFKLFKNLQYGTINSDAPVLGLKQM